MWQNHVKKLNLERLTYWPAQNSYMGHCRVCVFIFVGVRVTTIWGLLTMAANAQQQKISYSHYISLAHKIYVKFVLSLHCFHSVNKLGGWGSMPSILGWFLLLEKTKNQSILERKGLLHLTSQPGTQRQELKNRSWGALPTGLLASSHLATLWHNSSHLLGMVLPTVCWAHLHQLTTTMPPQAYTQANTLQAVLQLRLSSKVCPGDNQNKHHSNTSLIWRTICKVLPILRLVYKASEWQYSTQQAKIEYNTYKNTSFLWYFVVVVFVFLAFFQKLI